MNLICWKCGYDCRGVGSLVDGGMYVVCLVKVEGLFAFVVVQSWGLWLLLVVVVVV